MELRLHPDAAIAKEAVVITLSKIYEGNIQSNGEFKTYIDNTDYDP